MRKPIYKKWWFWVIVIVLLVGIFGGTKTSTKENKTTTVTSSPVEEKIENTVKEENSEIKDYYSLNEIYETKDYNLILTNYEEWTSDNQFTQPNDGNKIVRVFVSYNNTDNKDHSFGTSSFECYVNNKKYDSYIWSNETNDLDILQSIGAGRYTDGWMYFEVPENTTEIELEFSPNLFLSNKIIFKIP